VAHQETVVGAILTFKDRGRRAVGKLYSEAEQVPTPILKK
jgi:hypothetical protein